MRQSARPSFSGEPDAECDFDPRGDGRPPQPHGETLANADDLINQVMAEQRREQNLRSLPEILPNVPDDTSDAERDMIQSRRRRRRAWGRALDETPAHHFDTQDDVADPPRRGILARVFRRKRRVAAAPLPRQPHQTRHMRRWIVAAAIVSILVFQPQLFSGTLMMILWILFAASLLFGPGRVVDFLYALWGLFARHNPGLAGKLRRIGAAIEGGATWVSSKLPVRFGGPWEFRNTMIAPSEGEEGTEDPFDNRNQGQIVKH